MAVLMGAVSATRWSGFDMAQNHMLSDIENVQTGMESEGFADLVPDSMLGVVHQGLEIMDLMDPIEQASIVMKATGMDASLFDMGEASGPLDLGALETQTLDGKTAIRAEDLVQTKSNNGPGMG
ncbi:hypothetical protein [Marinobacterium sp. BA1]|uniref:hypothetical protein n=1 Tax=Marinobacterium sp. BA1 TaxID=3138931 RepID=UPI0032E60C68